MTRFRRLLALLLLFLPLLSSPARAQQRVDTLAFRLTANNEGDVALLRWANLGAGVYYDVYRHLPQEEGFQLLLTTDTIELHDTIARSVCHDTVAYYVSAWRGDTFYLSNRMALFFSDPNPTAACALALASVDPATQQLVLTWQPSPDDDVMGYVIHKGSNGSRQGSRWQAYDTVWGREAVRYACSGLDLMVINAFRLFAFDSCFQASALTAPYQNIVLHADVPECSRRLTLQWTGYINMPDPVAAYEVLLQVDDGAWQQVATRNVHQMLEYSCELPAAATRARAAVRAVGAAGRDTAWSNRAEVQLMGVGSIGFLSLDKVSVSDDNAAVILQATADSTFLTDGYTLYRSADGGAWTACGHLPFTGRAALRYADRTAAPAAAACRYRLGVPDACGGSETYSNAANSIFLSLREEEGAEDAVRLEWCAYEAWSGAVRYEVLRRPAGETLWHSLGTTVGRSYVDDLTLLGDQTGALQYKVVAHGADTLQSNTVRYAREVRVWLPNAITPGQQTNAAFCVQGRSLGAEGYELFIFSRTGQQLFYSSAPGDCWDGTVNGAAAPQGAYAYLLKYQDAEGRRQVKKGTVLLIR